MRSIGQTAARIDERVNSQMKKSNQHISFQGKETILYATSSTQNRLYIPTSTGQLAHDDNSFVRLIMGPYGSGKSTWCCHEIVRRTCNMPYWDSNGRRRARWGIVRNTSGELQSTTLQTWLTWFCDLGDVRKRQKPILTYEHTFNDGNGIVVLELLFLALDREEDLRKIKSLELTGCYINELSEVPQGALSHLKGRVNKRYPSPSFCPGDYWSGIICDTNPPDVDHWIYNDFELKTLESYKIFKQPPGLIKHEEVWAQNPLCDNSNNLAKDYYTKLAEGQSEDFVKVFCLGEYGSVGFGKKVYPEFNDAAHNSDKVTAIQGEPIHLGWDFGLTPACIVVQLSPRGQLRVLKEYTSEDMGIRTFAKNIVIPSLQRDFPYNKIGLSRGDPSGVAGDTIMEELSCIGELCSLGIDTIPALSNDLDSRIGAVRYFLNMMVDGQPAIIFSKGNTDILRRGFIKDYCFGRLNVRGEERYREVPVKNFVSHPHDALQYIVMEFAANKIMSEKAPKEIVDMRNPVMRLF